MFTFLIQQLRRLAGEESGPTAVEYAVMLALIIIVAITSVRVVGTKSSSVFQSSAQTLDQKKDGNRDGHGQY